MGCVGNEHIIICGNFNKITKRKPKNWIDTGYKMYVPYKFDWRDKVGKTECSCAMILECYRPYYGFSWSHHPECALMVAVEKRPQLMNLWQYQHLPQIPVADECE